MDGNTTLLAVGMAALCMSWKPLISFPSMIMWQLYLRSTQSGMPITLVAIQQSMLVISVLSSVSKAISNKKGTSYTTFRQVNFVAGSLGLAFATEARLYLIG
jgi:hypothetical protein